MLKQLLALALLIHVIVPSSNYHGWELGAASGTGSPAFFLVNDYPSNSLALYAGVNLTASTIYNLIVTYSAATKTASDVTFYVNGTLEDNESPLENSLAATTASGIPIHVGSRSDGSQPFDDSLSNLQIFSGALNSAQIAAIQAAGPQ